MSTSQCGNWTVPNDTFDVIVHVPKPFRTRCAETCYAHRSCCARTVFAFILASLAFLVYGLPWILISCEEKPDMALETLSIRDMTVYRNTTVVGSSSSSPRQVDSAFDVTLSTRNPNTVAGCFTTYRRVIVRVEYKSQTIVHQEIPLGFGLKPRQSRPVSIELRGQHFPLKNPDLGPNLEAELRNGSIHLDIYFDARYLRNDRKAGWLNLGCVVVAQSPSNSSSSLLLDQACYSP